MLQSNHYQGSEPDGYGPISLSQSQTSERGQDILKVLWRWKWLLLLGGTFGLMAGLLNYYRQSPTYASRALVQVVYPNVESVGMDSLDGTDGIRGHSRLDESRIIKSARVIELAVEAGNLESLPFFKDKSRTDIVQWILRPTVLTVEPAGRDSSTALLEVGFVCSNAEVSQLVVDAVIAGYDNYLETAYRNLGKELVGVVTQAQQSLQNSYRELSEKHAKFRKDAPMIWLGDEARNQFSENSVEINSSINQIQIEGYKLRAILDHIAEAERLGRPPETILMMLASDLDLRQVSHSPDILGEGITRASDALPFTSAERRAILMELQIKEQELLDTFGDEHPAVAGVRRRIELLTKQVASIASTERLLEEKLVAGGQSESSVALSSKEKLELWRSSLEERMAALDIQLKLLRELADENNMKSKELQDYMTTNRLLNSELQSVQALLDGYTDTLNRIQILPQGNRRTLEVLTPAEVGGFHGPALAPYLLGGTAIGLILIAGLAVLLDWWDKSFRSPDEISDTLGYAILGHVPQMLLKKSGKQAVDCSLCTIAGSSPQVSEAFRSIRTGLYFSEHGGESRVIQVTSPIPGDGKSTVAANLAATIAQSGRSVLLIDADLRRPRTAKLFGLSHSAGVADVIRGRVSFSEAIVASQLPNLSLLASLDPAESPAELLSHSRFVDLIQEARGRFDYVLVDSPPVLAVADASVVAARVDGVILTIRLRRDSRPLAMQASKMLDAVRAQVLGVVVNGVKATSSAYEYRYGSYGYGEAYVSASDSSIDLDIPSETIPSLGHRPR